MQAQSEMRIVNRRQERLDRVLLYLNPGLEIESLCLDGEPAPYSRTEQVVWVDRSLEPGREATANVNGKYGWISLGTFRPPEGTSVIRLTDRSDNPDNTVFADAVKWVLQD